MLVAACMQQAEEQGQVGSHYSTIINFRAQYAQLKRSSSCVMSGLMQGCHHKSAGSYIQHRLHQVDCVTCQMNRHVACMLVGPSEDCRRH